MVYLNVDYVFIVFFVVIFDDVNWEDCVVVGSSWLD